MQIFTSVLINTLALGIGASYGIGNVLLYELKDNIQPEESTENTKNTASNFTDRFSLTLNISEVAWFGKNNMK